MVRDAKRPRRRAREATTKSRAASPARRPAHLVDGTSARPSSVLSGAGVAGLRDSPWVRLRPQVDPVGRRAAVAAFDARSAGAAWASSTGRSPPPTWTPSPVGDGRSWPPPPDALLENRWATMEEYFAGLPPHRRGRLDAPRRPIPAASFDALACWTSPGGTPPGRCWRSRCPSTTASG
jgi:hypothetical protein